jgi:hypothetical protein
VRTILKAQEASLEEVSLFDRLRPQIQTLCNELKELSRKKADAPLSKFKVKLINEKLKETNGLLGDAHRPFQDFDLLDQDNLPTTSDSVIVLSQYLESLETWRSARVRLIEDNSGSRAWYWNISDQGVWVKASGPTRSRIIEQEAEEDEEADTDEEETDEDMENGDEVEEGRR